MILLGLIIISCGLVDADENITFTYPENVIVGEVFEVNLTLIDFAKDIYDVKIEITDGSTHNIAQRFYEDEWRSTNYWMYNYTNTSITNNKIIRLNIIEDYNNITNLTVIIRKNGGSNILEQNYLLNITSAPPEDLSENNDSEISIEVEWDEEEIINGEDFKIKIIAKNLDENEDYDIKVWIEIDDDDDENHEKEISQTYNDDSEWVSYSQYYDKFFSKDIDETNEIKLRIHEDYSDYTGDARIYFRIREDGGSYISDLDTDKYIEILEPEEDDTSDNGDSENDPARDAVIQAMENQNSITGNVISLGSSNSIAKTEDLKEQENIIYQSKTELIKKYSIYGFALFCVALSALLAFEKLK